MRKPPACAARQPSSAASAPSCVACAPSVASCTITPLRSRMRTTASRALRRPSATPDQSGRHASWPAAARSNSANLIDDEPAFSVSTWPVIAVRSPPGSDVILVLVEEANRLRQCVAAERIAQLARAHDLDDGGLAVLHLRIDRALQSRADVLEPVDDDALGAHRLRDAREALVVELARDEAAVVEVDLVLLLGPPLAV